MKQNHLKIRTALYFVGLFVMTIGIALSVKSNLGVSPVSSIPYTMTCVWGIEMGKATILFHIVLVLLQILLLRRKFKPAQLLQVLVGVVFGYFTTFCNYMVSFLPTPDDLVIRVGMVLVSVLTCLTCLHGLGSVGAGTVIAAVLVGTLVGVLNRAFGKRRDAVMGREAKRIQHTAGYQQKTGLQVEL